MTRGIIGGIFTPEQADHHLILIKEHLLFPDGARLMDRPTQYLGGRETVFRRSESASFFGREIGLQYVHAHLRYCEALAVLGRPEELLEALMVVNPIAVTEVVRGAGIRQRNCYFSSSDAAFKDRYEASRDYDKLKRGEIAVDGGWRIYSSGPGIYANLVIRHLFGIRRHFDFMEFDPVLPSELDGIACDITHDGKPVGYRFSVNQEKRAVQGVSINGKPLAAMGRDATAYRKSGIRILKHDFDAALAPDVNIVQIHG